MSWQFSIFGLLFLVVTAIAVGVTVQGRRRSFPGAEFFILFMTSAAFWSLTSALEWFVALPDEKAFWSQISYFGIVNAAPAFFCFVLAYSGFERLLVKRNVLLVWIIPVITLLIALTNRWHGWNWPSYAMIQHPSGNYMYYEHGPSFWVLTAYSYMLNLASGILLLRMSGKLFRLYQTQSLIIFAAVMIPWIGNVLYNTRIVAIIDLTPAAFTFTGMLLWWNMKQFYLFDILPVARESLFTTIKELVIVLDAHGRIIDMNPSAQKHFGFVSIPIGTPAEEAFASWDQFRKFVGTDILSEMDLECPAAVTGSRWFAAAKTTLTASNESPAGVLIMCREVTVQKRIQQDRELLIKELRDALASVKTLSGLLPICATCKKIRNDEGYWQQVEGYVAEHTDATFTHGICPDCAEKALAAFMHQKKIFG